MQTLWGCRSADCTLVAGYGRERRLPIVEGTFPSRNHEASTVASAGSADWGFSGAVSSIWFANKFEGNICRGRNRIRIVRISGLGSVFLLSCANLRD